MQKNKGKGKRKRKRDDDDGDGVSTVKVANSVVKATRMPKYRWDRVLFEAKRTVDERARQLQHHIQFEQKMKDLRKEEIRRRYWELKSRIHIECRETITNILVKYKTSQRQMKVRQKSLKREQSALKHLMGLKVYSSKHEDKLASICDAQQTTFVVENTKPQLHFPPISNLKTLVSLSPLKILSFRGVMRPLFDEIHPVFSVDIVGVLDAYLKPVRLKLNRAPTEIRSTHSCLAAVGDGLFATGNGEGFIKIWDAKSGELISRHKPHQSAVRSILKIGTMMMASVALSDPVVKLTNIVTGECVHRLDTKTTEHTSFSLLDDGRYIVTSTKRNVSVWSVSSGQCVRSFTQPFYKTALNVCTSNSRRLIIATKPCQIWSPFDDGPAQKTTEISIPNTRANNLYITLNDCRKMIGYGRNGIAVWDVESGQCIRNITASYGRICVFPDEDRILVIHDQSCKIYDICTGVCLQTISLKANGYIVCILSCGSVVVGDGSILTIFE